MEKLKGKHDHSLTKILKVLVFAIVLLMPFLVFLPTGLYYGCNRKAENTNYVKTPIYETNEVNTFDDLVEGNIYFCDNLLLSEFDDNNFIINIYKCESVNFSENFQRVELGETYIYNYECNNNSYISINCSSTTIFIYLTNDDAYQEIYWDTDYDESFINCYFSILNVDNFIDNNENRNWYTNHPITISDWNLYEYTPSTTITQSMSIAWEEMWETPLFAWTKNTPFTATTNAFASVFNISNESGFYYLIAYFITMTCIYLIIDIVIGISTTLTHKISGQE